jgi:hypothetical protein
MDNLNSSPKSLNPTRKHSQRIVSMLVLITTTIACFSSGLISSAVAGQQSESSAETGSRVENPTPPATTRDERPNSKPPAESRRSEPTSVWAAIWNLLKLKRQEEPPLGSRSQVCEISPGLLEEKNTIWSDRPLFLWQGTAPSIEIRLYSPFNPDREQELLWSQTVTAESQTTQVQSVPYTGGALEPGQSYDWELVILSSEEGVPKKARYTFQVMESSERDHLAAELAAMETQLKTAEATVEEIALQRANYFAQRDLWSDALQEIYSVKNPSADLTSNAQEILSYLCESSSSQTS